MKPNQIALIAGAVIVLAVVFLIIYSVSTGNKGPDPAKAAPEHQDMAAFYRNQGRGGSPGGSGGAPGGGAPVQR